MFRARSNMRLVCAIVAGTGAFAGSAGARTGPDVVVSIVGPDLTKYGTRDTGTPEAPRLVTAYALTTTACNIGDAPAAWVDVSNQHPVIAQQLYRLHAGRFEQIGLSWLKHAFCAADEPSCLNLAPSPGAIYQGDFSCYTLGLFANDTYSSFLNSRQYTLGPRSEVDAANGAFPYPFTLGWGQTGDCLYKRLQVANADLNPANYPGARYFAEVQYVTPDEAPAARVNNASYREALVGGLSGGQPNEGCSTASQGYNLALTGATVPFEPAIEAWKTVDPSVVLIPVDIPNDGRVILACKAAPLGGGLWSYEYAIYNHNSGRAVGLFSLPKSRDPGVAITALGFHAPACHSGEPYSNDPWTPTVAAGSVTWSAEPFDTNPNANAIRWGTLYNFRFLAQRAPVLGAVTIGLFGPGGPDDPPTVRVAGVPVPADACVGDFDGSGDISLQDLFDFLGAYFSGSPGADVNRDAQLTVQDIFDFLASWFGGC